MKKLTLFGTAALGLLAIVQVVSAQETVVGVQIPGWASVLNGGTGYPFTPNVGYYAGAVQQQYWNEANGSAYSYSSPVTFTNASLTYGYGGTGSTTLMDSTGAASAMTFSVSNITYNGGSTGGDGFPDDTVEGNPDWEFSGSSDLSKFLVSGIASSSSSAAPITLTLGGLSSGDIYNLYAYVASDFYAGGVNATVTLGSESLYLITDNGTLTGLTQSTATTAATATMAHYVEFTDIPGAELMSESLTVGGVYTGLSGFQVEDAGPVPEPATYAMMLGGFGMLIAARRIRRGQKQS